MRPLSFFLRPAFTVAKHQPTHRAFVESPARRLALASETGAQLTFRGILFSLSGHRLRYAQKLQCIPGLAVKTPSAIPWAAAFTRSRAASRSDALRVVTTATFSCRLWKISAPTLYPHFC